MKSTTVKKSRKYAPGLIFFKGLRSSKERIIDKERLGCVSETVGLCRGKFVTETDYFQGLYGIIRGLTQTHEQNS